MSEESNDNEKSKVADVIKATSEVLDKVPVYQDAIQPVAKEAGKALGTIGRAVNVALSPIKGLVWGYDKIEELLTIKLEKKLKHTTTEDIQTPAIEIAGPVLESLRFTAHNESLSELYANLLSTSMDKKTAMNAHPGFVEIIRNLGSDEAKIFSYLISNDSQPIIDIRKKNEDIEKGGSTFLSYVCHLGTESKIEHNNLIGTYLVNLKRLGLVDIKEGSYLTQEGVYDSLLEEPFVKEACTYLDATEGYESDIVKYFVSVSELGKVFGKACIATNDK